MTLDERVDRLEAIARRSPEWEAYKRREWRQTRCDELRAAGMSGRQARKKAWYEAQSIDVDSLP